MRAAGASGITLAWIAIALGVLALPGLIGLAAEILGVGDSQGLGFFFSLTPWLAIVSWILAIIATVIAGRRIARRKGDAQTVLAFLLAAPGAILGTGGLLVVASFLGVELGISQDNEAESAGRPAVATYTENGAELLCDNGDNGYGVNGYPWFQAFIDAPADLGSEALAREALAAAGYPGAERSEVSEYYDVPRSADAFEIHSLEVDEETLRTPKASIVVLPSGPVSLSCHYDGEYGRDFTPSSDRVVVFVQIALDHTGR